MRPSGESAGEVARKLRLSAATVKADAGAAYRSLGASGRAPAIAIAHRLGLIT